MPEKIRDKTYQKLSDAAYSDKKYQEYELQYKSGNETWKSVNDKSLPTNDKGTGFDATVFKKGDEVVIAFRGTEGNKIVGRGWNDVVTDVEYIAGSRPVHELDPHVEIKDKKLHIDWERENQFKQAEELVKEVQKKYPNSKITTTGHSLGGALASYTAALFNLESVTYNAPSVKHQLPEEIQKKVEKGEYDKTIVNYVNPQDAIGAGALAEYDRHIGSTYYIGPKYDVANIEANRNPLTAVGRLFNSPFGVNNHGMDHFEFDIDGNLSNTLLTNVLTGQAITQSPRYTSGDTATIKVTPADLKDVAKDIEQYSAHVEECCSKAKNAIHALENIYQSEEVITEVLTAIHNFQGWFTEDNSRIVNNLTAAAESFEKADVLK